MTNVRNGAHPGASRKSLAPACLRLRAGAAGRCLEQDGGSQAQDKDSPYPMVGMYLVEGGQFSALEWRPRQPGQPGLCH